MKLAKVSALALLLAWGGAVRASYQIGVYAVVDQVVYEPSQGPAEKVQLWGAFALAGDRPNYKVARGYLYFSFQPGQAKICRQEWADFKKLQGTGQVIGFGSRRLKVTVRKANAKLEKPEAYPVANGLYKINKELKVAKLLRSLPAPEDPPEGSAVESGAVTLKVRNVYAQTAKTRYVFEIVNSSGAKEVSRPVAPGKKEAAWTPKMKVKFGVKYTWRVHVVTGDWKGPVSEMKFRGKKA
jgi:hypothetical protein